MRAVLCRHDCATVCTSLEWGCSPRSSNAIGAAAESQGQLPGSEGLSPATAQTPLCGHKRVPSSTDHPAQPDRGLDEAVLVWALQVPLEHFLLLHLQPESSSSLAFLRLLDAA